jgi:hypothetical protein
MKEVKVSSKQGTVYALVDDADYDRVNRYWRIKKGYPMTKVYVGKRNGRSFHKEISMHRYILGDLIPVGLQCDHVNRNRLDNRRCNLRPVTLAQQAQNKPAQARNATGFRGVQWDRSCGRYKACAVLDGKTKSLGYYDDPAEAAVVVSDWRSRNMTHSTEGIAP